MSDAVIKRIHAWAVDRYGWQLDAIRRVYEAGGYTPQDIAELEMMCLAANQVALPEGVAALNPRSLDFGKDMGGGNAAGAVSITGLSNVQNVNRLAPEQKLSFAPTGMTIVYGDNGAGKSGYARILRALCRARCPNRTMLPDIFVGAKGYAKVTVGFRVGADDVSADWSAGQAPPSPLASVSVFDSDCATVHVTGENDIAFTPFGLDILPKLANLFVTLRDRFRDRVAEAKRGRPAALDGAGRYPDTTTARLIAGLGPKTNVEDIRRHATINDAEKRRLKNLADLLAQDPASLARVLQVRHGRLAQLRDLCDRGFALLGDAQVAELHRLWNASRAAAQAADLAARNALAPDDLPGVGGEVWRILWNAARRYSQGVAYAGQDFPVTAEASRCVLCQQSLQPEAARRLQRFEDFVKGEARRAADAAAHALLTAMQPLRELDCGPGVGADNVRELALEDADLGGVVQEVLARLEDRRIAALRCCDAAAWAAVPPLPVGVHDRLTAFLDAVEQRRQDALRAAQAEERGKLQSELKELQSREWLATVLADVEREVARLVYLERLEGCLRDVATDAVTRKNTELTDEFVTAALRQAFKDELKLIGLDYLGTELVKVGGQYGSTKYQVQVPGAKHAADLPSVVSEGELRAIALAAFLAELATAPSRSGLIFDDPVSSLDHNWRERFARRLVGEAAGRQVVIFTHDLVFLMDLLDLAKKQGVECSAQCLRRAGDWAGKVVEGLPWGGMTVSKRIGVLRQAWHRAEKVCRTVDEVAYEPIARDLYGALRETWERAVEEVLFNDVVQRLRRGVETLKLRQLAGDITEEDCKIVDENMTLCSRYLRGHDHAPAINEPVPKPDQLKAHIDVLESWVASVRARR